MTIEIAPGVGIVDTERDGTDIRPEVMAAYYAMIKDGAPDNGVTLSLAFVAVKALETLGWGPRDQP